MMKLGGDRRTEVRDVGKKMDGGRGEGAFVEK